MQKQRFVVPHEKVDHAPKQRTQAVVPTWQHGLILRIRRSASRAPGRFSPECPGRAVCNFLHVTFGDRSWRFHSAFSSATPALQRSCMAPMRCPNTPASTSGPIGRGPELGFDLGCSNFGDGQLFLSNCMVLEQF